MIFEVRPISSKNGLSALKRTCQFLDQLSLLSDVIPCNMKCAETEDFAPSTMDHTTVLQGYPTESDTVGIFPVCNGGEPTARRRAARRSHARARARGPSHATVAAKGRSVHGKCKRFSVTEKVKLKCVFKDHGKVVSILRARWIRRI